MSDDKKQTPEQAPTDKPEIRYVPIEYMPGMHDDDDEIDLLELAKKIWDGRWTIIKITGVFILLGLFWALFSPVEYESEAILMPEIQVQETGGTAGRLLQQFGGAFGLGGIGAEGMPAGTIPPLLYPRIVNSLPFQLELLNHEVEFRDYGVTTTWPDFLEIHYPTPLATLAVDYTVKLPLTVLSGVRSLFEDDPDSLLATLPDDPTQSQYISITEEQQELVNQLRERISVSQDEETGLLTTRVKLQDARASAELNRFLIERLKEYVIDYRLEKARQNLEFAQDQLAEAETRFEETQVALAEFQDRNVSLGTARAQIELERLQDEKNLAFNVYSSVAQQVEQARLTLQEQTPIFKEVQAVTVPSENSDPNRPMVLVVFTLLGGILAVGYVFISPLVSNLGDHLS
ncbi:Wzz/FepE/Etk N-terminal domain-containing protein [Rhodohalobacter mucosus]|uniref:Polysaccharide chain length determinant N-terminal domain-containing protein n=1 Tax=Rhodohalobacter mucosus TaxID=2079485 RepID=A0A316TW81_9BACT|nr:Wzz/FepE/Etk N-terminal domain-containing protein [Rhodohalobacter mucosus]PWN07455.1 hypothetical protein DDZ15_04115 [Rhodohalobacter mucosus]